MCYKTVEHNKVPTSSLSFLHSDKPFGRVQFLAGLQVEVKADQRRPEDPFQSFSGQSFLEIPAGHLMLKIDYED